MNKIREIFKAESVKMTLKSAGMGAAGLCIWAAICPTWLLSPLTIVPGIGMAVFFAFVLAPVFPPRSRKNTQNNKQSEQPSHP
jgi:hypothetical protein